MASKNVRNAVRILNAKLIGNKIILIIHLINTPFLLNHFKMP